jgi:predicted GNAT family acetyltransferase
VVAAGGRSSVETRRADAVPWAAGAGQVDDMSETPDIEHRPHENRFVTTVDGQLAQVQYDREGDRLVITHTLVPSALEGRGLGWALVAACVDHAASEGCTVVSACWFADQWLAKNPEAAAKVGAGRG